MLGNPINIVTKNNKTEISNLTYKEIKETADFVAALKQVQ